jgi:hypothetical protein
MKPTELMIGFKYIPQYEGLYSIDRSGNVLSKPQEFPLPNDIISCPPDCHDTSKTERQL